MIVLVLHLQPPRTNLCCFMTFSPQIWVQVSGIPFLCLLILMSVELRMKTVDVLGLCWSTNSGLSIFLESMCRTKYYFNVKEDVIAPRIHYCVNNEKHIQSMSTTRTQHYRRVNEPFFPLSCSLVIVELFCSALHFLFFFYFGLKYAKNKKT